NAESPQPSSHIGPVRLLLRSFEEENLSIPEVKCWPEPCSSKPFQYLDIPAEEVSATNRFALKPGPSSTLMYRLRLSQIFRPRKIRISLGVCVVGMILVGFRGLNQYFSNMTRERRRQVSHLGEPCHDCGTVKSN